MISYDLFKDIENYAIRHTESSKDLYTKRNQNIDRIFINCLNGKIAEFACYNSMVSAGYILENKPDLQIHSASNKSHEADLICIGKNKTIYENKRHIHIKSVSMETYAKYGASFLVEKNNRLINNPDTNHYYSVLLQTSLTDYKFYRWINTCDVTYQNPRKLMASKLAVYLD